MKRFSVLCRYASGLMALMGFVQTPSTLADPPAPAPVPEVTVTAPKLPSAAELAGPSVANFVAAHARPSIATGMLARWHDPVCARAVGLPPDLDTFIAARIAAVAASVGAPAGAADCKPNIHIFFTDDPQTLITQVAQKYPYLLGFHYPHQTESVASVRHSIEGWYETATQGADGGVALDQPVRLNSADQDGLNGKLQSKTPPGRAGSHLGDRRSSLLVHVLIVADVHAVGGLQIRSISDYLALLVLSQTRQQDACGQLPSILDLLAPECDREKPTAVTASDLAFLRALYATADQGAPYYMEKASIDGRVRSALVPH